VSNGTPEDKDQAVESMTGTVDRWKARIDELKVRAELGKHDVRDKAEKQLEVAQNACLAAYSKLRDARHDAAASADSVRESVDLLLHDVKKAFDAAQDVISRG
jgi:hypothetical protein